jgi:Domain of unknown function (DUF4157)/Effector protein
MTLRQFDTPAKASAKRSPARRTAKPDAEAVHTAHHHDPVTGLAAGVDALPRPQAAALSRASGGRLARAGQALLGLQRLYGNHHVQQVVGHAGQAVAPGRGPVIQTKLALGSVDDRYERDADRVARQVGGLMRSRSLPDQEDSGSTAWPDLEASIGRRGGGQALTDPVVKPMEHAFGADFRHVRVHSDAESDELCRSIAARAFTLGDHIFFRKGENAGEGTSGRHLLAHELAHVVQQRGPGAREGGGAAGRLVEHGGAPHDTVQAFWVKTGGQYRWKRDPAKKRKYVRTGEKRGTFKRPLRRAVYVDPWADGGHLGIDPSMAPQEEQPQIEASVIGDLKTIRRTDVGAKLLRKLATKAHGHTTILPQPDVPGPVTQTEPLPSGQMSANVVLTPGDLDALATVADMNIQYKRPKWNPTPGHAVLFHELVHAYHWHFGTRAPGAVTEDQAIHQGDVGVGMSEYQTVGLNTRDADPEHQYADDRFTENAYRDATHLPHRDTYIPRRKLVKKTT